MAGYSSQQASIPTILTVTTAVNFSKGIPGTAGVANDTIVTGIKILRNAGAATCTFNSGFRKEDGTQATTQYVFSGLTTQDVYVSLNWLNSAGALQVTASVANTVIIETMTSGFVP
jgi:hypothetical protein